MEKSVFEHVRNAALSQLSWAHAQFFIDKPIQSAISNIREVYKGNSSIFREADLSTWSTLKGKNLLPLGANSFLLE